MEMLCTTAVNSWNAFHKKKWVDFVFFNYILKGIFIYATWKLSAATSVCTGVKPVLCRCTQQLVQLKGQIYSRFANADDMWMLDFTFGNVIYQEEHKKADSAP